MLEVDTFLTTHYVIVDDFCQSHPPKKRPGLQRRQSPAEPQARERGLGLHGTLRGRQGLRGGRLKLTPSV
jgi:hypothetical protein